MANPTARSVHSRQPHQLFAVILLICSSVAEIMWFNALVIAVLALCLPQGDALKCHMCNSATDAKCGDPIDSSVQLTECTPSIFKDGVSMLKDAAETVTGLLGKVGIDSPALSVPDANAAFACMKAVRQDGDKKVVLRSCSVPKNDKFDMCQQLKAQGGVVTFCDTCDTDGCNAASGVVPTSLLLLLAAAVVALLAKQ